MLPIALLPVAALHNRFYKIELPTVLSFFGGTRFVPTVCTAVYLVVGIAMFYVWPIVQQGIAMLGNLVINSGYIGTWIYGITERALIPFGLHHVIYMPFWQSAMGGKYFEAHVSPEQQVKKGGLLVSFDMDAIQAEGYPLTTPHDRLQH